MLITRSLARGYPDTIGVYKSIEDSWQILSLQGCLPAATGPCPASLRLSSYQLLMAQVLITACTVLPGCAMTLAAEQLPIIPPATLI